MAKKRYLQAKVLKNSLKILSVEGFTGVVGEPLFFVFLDAADKGAIGEKIVLSGKTFIRTRKLPMSFRVCI